MLQRTDVLRIIDEGYAARARGDKAALAALWAPGATFRVAAAPGVLEKPLGLAIAAGPAVDALIDRVAFKDYHREEAVIEGNKAAVLWRVTLSAPGKDPVTTQLYDLWTINDDGRIASILQFGDTATIAELLA